MDIAKEHHSNPATKEIEPSLPLYLISNLDDSITTPVIPHDQPIITVPILDLTPHQTSHQETPPTTTTSSDFPPTTANLIPDDEPLISSTTAPPPIHASIEFELSSNPFEKSVDISILVTGDHPTLGLDLLHHTDNAQITLKFCVPSTPAARIPHWRSTL